MSVLESYNWHGWEFQVNSDARHWPYLQQELTTRVNKKQATNVIVTGEGGTGKTYIAGDICRVLEPRRFTMDQVVFRYVDFMRSVIRTGQGVPIVFDEPSYAMGKREWFKELNQALVKTIESFRYLVHPLFIPIINKSLLDKTIRSYLLQFHIVLQDRGKGMVYRMSPSPFEDKVYKYFFCNVDYALFDNDKCAAPTCLGCRWLEHDKYQCETFRANYERKKAETQEERYDQNMEEAERKETSELTLDQIEYKLGPYLDHFMVENKEGVMEANLVKLKTIMKRKLQISIGHNKSYDLKGLVDFDIINDPRRLGL